MKNMKDMKRVLCDLLEGFSAVMKSATVFLLPMAILAGERGTFSVTRSFGNGEEPVDLSVHLVAPEADDETPMPQNVVCRMGDRIVFRESKVVPIRALEQFSY